MLAATLLLALVLGLTLAKHQHRHHAEAVSISDSDEPWLAGVEDGVAADFHARPKTTHRLTYGQSVVGAIIVLCTFCCLATCFVFCSARSRKRADDNETFLSKL